MEWNSISHYMVSNAHEQEAAVVMGWNEYLDGVEGNSHAGQGWWMQIIAFTAVPTP